MKIEYNNLLKMLCFCFVTDDSPGSLSFIDQVKIALNVGATLVQYRNKSFNLYQYDELVAIRSLCRERGVTFIINDDVLLAKAIDSDGVHLGQKDTETSLAREILGRKVIIGLSISSLNELYKSDLKYCDYIGVGPVFHTITKLDASIPHGLDVLKEISYNSSVPTVAIGGINPSNAKLCMEYGAVGVAVVSCITLSDNPIKVGIKLASICCG